MASSAEILNLQSDRLLDQRVAFVGRLAGMSRRDAHRVVRQHQGICVEEPIDATLLVVGEEELLGELSGEGSLLDEETQAAVELGELAVLSETELWQRLGFVDAEHDARRLYTPAMLADLLNVPVAVVRRWHRRGLIVPVREVRRLPYFDFEEVATARRLAELLAAGCSPAGIERKLAELARFLPHVKRPLAQLSVIIQGQQLLLRQGDGLIEPGGQLRFDFESVEPPSEDDVTADIHSLEEVRAEQLNTPDELARAAGMLEDEGRLAEAAEMYRALLAATGPSAAVSFCLAEVLYRLGDLPAARERYYMAIELDEDYVEARANLGCVLAELGEIELAIASFLGALEFHGEYPDAHYHLARLLDQVQREDEALAHWQTFLELAADSPWAEEARTRLAATE